MISAFLRKGTVYIQGPNARLVAEALGLQVTYNRQGLMEVSIPLLTWPAHRDRAIRAGIPLIETWVA